MNTKTDYCISKGFIISNHKVEQINIFRYKKFLIYQRKINMEEKSIIHTNALETSLSDWKLRHNMQQTSRNYRQLQNRLNILQLEKKKKLKDIENKLNIHKKFVQNKIYKHQLKTSIQNWSNNQVQRSNSNSRIFQAIKQSRNMNIKKKHEDLIMSKHKVFEEIKNARKQNQRKIHIKKLESLEEKIGKRNRVRLIQIGCKENIENFWNQKLESFQEDRKMDMSRKLKHHEQNLKRLQSLQRNEYSLLDQIKRAQNVQFQLKDLIQNQRSMDGSKLDNLYFSKVFQSTQ